VGAARSLTLELAVLVPWLPSVVLHMVRVGAFFVGQPMFGVTGDSRMVRLVLMVALGGLFFCANGMPIVRVTSVIELGFLAAREATIGLALGFAVRLMTATMSTAGEMISQEMGFQMAQIVDPVTGRSSPVVSQLFEAVALLLIFELDIHHRVLQMFGALFDVLPVAAGFSIEAVHAHLRDMVTASIVLGARYAMPVLGVMTLLTAVLIMLARAVPNINLLEFSFGVRILLALLASVWFLTAGTPFLESMFETILEHARHLFAPI
jgi:flagellar biosynthetic protein FliR